MHRHRNDGGTPPTHGGMTTENIKRLLEEANIGNITVADRILLHLMGFNLRAGSICVPFDLTQDGIATILGITRAHASVELKKLDAGGYLEVWKSHLPGCATRRLSYVLSPTGVKRASALADMLREHRITPDMLLNVRRCNPIDLWNGLCEEDRDVMGKACVLRVGIPVKALPRMKNGSIPSDGSGNICIPVTVSRIFLGFAEPPRLRSWHMWAAEYWLNHGNCVERLYHLVNADMVPEAGMCVSVNRREFESRPTPDLLRIIRRIVGKGPYNIDVCTVGASIAMDLGKADVADEILETMKMENPDVWSVMKSVSLLYRGMPAEAAALAEVAFDRTGDPLAASVASEAYADMGDAESAVRCSDMAMEAVAATGDGEHLDDVFMAMARSSLLSGYCARARAWAVKAERCAPACRKGRPAALIEKIDGTPAGAVQ